MNTISIIGSGDMAAAIGDLAARARALAEQFGAGATTGTCPQASSSLLPDNAAEGCTS